MSTKYEAPSESELALIAELEDTELSRLQKENRQLQRRVDALMTEKTEVIKHAKGLQRQLDKIRKIHGS